jgi:prepilin-type processing-associated H-X9-DG protein
MTGNEPYYSGFHTVMPPNSVSGYGWNAGGIAQSTEMNGVITPSSYHTGGVNVARVDGSVHFISNTIGTGDISVTIWHTINSKEAGKGIVYTQSPYGVWGAIGTISGGESVSEP